MYIKKITILISLLLLTACSRSVDFVRPADNALTLGKTTRGEIVALLKRDTDTIGQKLINNTLVEEMTYSHFTMDTENSDNPEVYGTVATRGQYYYLKDNILVGTDYYSTFAKDSTKFDTSKVTSIIKGKSTKADVINMFGNPSIKMIKPLVSDKGVKAIGYHYRTMNIANGGNLKMAASKLIIELNENDVVVNIQYETNKTRNNKE